MTIFSYTNKQDIQEDESPSNQNIDKDNITYKIIIDDPAKDATDFRKYSERLSQIIANSDPQFTVGIFGGWGTGKTTMMKMIKSELENTQIISWKNIEQDSEKNKLKKCIKDTYKIDWIDNAECKKVDDKILILENSGIENKFSRDNKDTYSAKQSNKFSLLIKEKKAILKPNKGKSRDLRIIEENDNNLFIYLPNQQILTIWFDAWKYENEEFSALVPFVRTIILHLEEYVTKFDQNVQKIAITNLIKNFKKMGASIIRNSKPTIGFENFGARVSVETDINKVLGEYKSEGSFTLGQHEIRFYKHISEKIEDELKKIRNSDGSREKKIEKNVELEETRKFRLVIFIDDLDRCTPYRALEILESIKTFFDIEGIICIIGMDPATIDPIIHTKYGENSKIDGLDYLQKIVQLPFQIPLWSDKDLTDAIREMTKRTGLPNDVTDKLLKPEIKDLIIKSAKLNPRNIKRFINSLVLSYGIYDQNLKGIDDQNLKNYIIENYLKSMISIQTFYFRGEKWLQFVKMIMDYKNRVQFLTHFITFIESENITSYQDLEDKIKDIPTLKYPKYNKKILEIYNKISEINDEDLFTFLTQAAEPLLKIGNIENYLRAVDTKKDIDATKSILEIKSYESINKLQHRMQDFIDYVKNSIIHLPYLTYSELELEKGNKLEKIDLSKAFLFRADLSGANLMGADLSGANLTDSNLMDAKLSEANLSSPYFSKIESTGLQVSDMDWTKLRGADLSGANLILADLSGANLMGADLSGANLTSSKLPGAKLSFATLTGADLSGANLTGANLSYANLSYAKLMAANLTGANLSYAKLLGTNLSYAKLPEVNLSFATLIGADLMATLLVNANLSNSIIISQQYELLELNEKTNFANAISDNSNLIYYISNFTENIPALINNKKELKMKLEQRQFGKQERFSKEYIESILSISNLPE